VPGVAQRESGDKKSNKRLLIFLSNKLAQSALPYIMKAPGCSNLIPRIAKPGLGFSL
jgi:hypothetical protein